MAQAQADLGSCSGVVTDATGAVIPSAQVTLTNVATGAVRTTVTNSKGEYSVTQLLPAAYTVKFGAEGFSTSVACLADHGGLLKYREREAGGER